MNCPMNVFSYAQIAFKKRNFQARSASAVEHILYVEHIRVCASVSVMCAVGAKPLGILS